MNILFSSLLLLLISCATSPTGRNQLLLISDGRMNAMGIDAYSQMKRKIPIETQPSKIEYVRCIARKLTFETIDPTGVNHWEVTVFRDQSANAFALPGGKIGVHTGLLKIAKNKHQLAAVIGHEIGHVIARHGNERVSSSLIANVGMASLGMALKDKKNSNLILAGLGLGTQVGLLLPHSRAQESEADQIGLNLMAKAGFDPRESTKLWANMKVASRGAPPEFLSTHPAHDTRIEHLQSRIPAAMKLYQRAQANGKNPKCSL